MSFEMNYEMSIYNLEKAHFQRLLIISKVVSYFHYAETMNKRVRGESSVLKSPSRLARDERKSLSL